ncbi:MAG: hypothetical protein LBI28_06610 [Treponema sp.]|jgi:hypothetical protein|nr:hypothetical protein [Treponema sp.]
MKKTKKTMKEILNDFIEESLKNRKAPHKQIVIGMIKPSAQQRIKDKCGHKISKIEINRNGVVHAMRKKEHNLEADALLYAVDVINTTTDISLSPKQHKGSNVLIFKKEIGNEITFLTEVHIRKNRLLVLMRGDKKGFGGVPMPSNDSQGLTSKPRLRLPLLKIYIIGGEKSIILNTAIPFQTLGADLTARPQRGIAIYLNILRDILDVKS